MTGLNLETFLQLLRADVGAWATLGLVAGLLALMAWTSWGSRRALRKCLVLSIAAHVGLVFYGSTWSILSLTLEPRSKEPAREGIRQVRVSPLVERSEVPGSTSPEGRAGRAPAAWDRLGDAVALASPTLLGSRPETRVPEVVRQPPTPISPEPAAPEVSPPAPPVPDARPEDEAPPLLPPAEIAPGDPDEVAAPSVPEPKEPEAEAPVPALGQGRLRPDRLAAGEPRGEAVPARPAPAPLPDVVLPDTTAPVVVVESRPIGRSVEEVAAIEPAGDPGAVEVSAAERPRAAPASEPEEALPEADVRRRSRPQGEAVAPPRVEPPRRLSEGPGPLLMARATPAGIPDLPEIRGAVGGRPLEDVPAIYRSRLDPNRSALAQRAGASSASEQAVERALDWLARHQDADGRWDGGTIKSRDGNTPAPGEDNFMVHCPPGELCFGECFYWEADTAQTGLALLAFLGAGYTHLDGIHAEVVGKGLDFLILSQKPDGDLRGESKAVGMYCHAMAALALSEAYALTADERLRAPVERAIGFLARSRAADGMAWRYAPGAPTGDTSILGWVVLAFKSAKEAGIAAPDAMRDGTLSWLGKVSYGRAKGLAAYQPNRPVTPTMTAEAWVCRQFLGADDPRKAGVEAAEYLLQHGPDRDEFNLYYWYYGTLAMYQHGGESWSRWNAQVRDQLVRRQRRDGHQAGSWDPDDSLYGTRGGRIYGTALAAMTLEVYYRYLRLYDAPGSPPMLAPKPPRPTDPTLRRAGTSPKPRPR